MSSTDFENISFDLPKNQSNVIKVIGVGGGGSNAINHMFQQGIKGVDFVICNTDAQALENSTVPNKIQLGVSLTEGLGAGANPQIGEQAAVESFEEIKRMLDTNTKMVFITAGMGGGTGTGAAPIIAKQAKEMDILTVGIVTIPFQFEGKMRNEQAQQGVEKLRSHVDSLIVINNNKLREVYGNLGFKAGFSKADEVLATASRGIAEVITHHYTQNIDLRDAKTVLSNSGTAIMGSATASGANRANDAIIKALDSPLLNDNKIKGAKNVLLLIVSGSEEITIDEIGEINDHIQTEAGHSANIIMGVGEDEALEDAIAVTIIATGFNVDTQNEIVNTETKKIIHTLEDEQRAEHNFSAAKFDNGRQLPEDTASGNEAPKIVHTLDEEIEEVEAPPKNDNLNTPPSARNMDVIYEEVNYEEENFIITDTSSAAKEIEVNEPEEIKNDSEEQFMFTFDFPINNKKEEEKKPAIQNENRQTKQSVEKPAPKKVIHNLSEETREMEVNEPIEIIPVTESTATGVKRYSLDDYMEVEQMLKKSKPTPKKPEEEEVVFEKKTVAPKPQEQVQGEEHDPFNNPISESLIARAAERRAKMKEFNYKFRNNAAQIEEIERQPAYKRAGIDLDSSRPGEEKLSRTSLGGGDKDDLRFRSNNSFLHDNVD
ncbi:cell division protein FtsZ [Antarcticibacterium flavum]|uniref:Cell division protein FtsZ n=1 Tax=Antarcticibacterium flavum TaxID=2058175 RepID=A0A5B7X396_9FLAO|nr:MULTISPECIES: cell division protein FtsZ [Antarcticibacterium]MCM4161505.1 cell division protein FtsZ [Antarcticibacterium sp. W02-3]QCY69108.1 cell division protein FtsZ [Antarcticibacterium flavum]